MKSFFKYILLFSFLFASFFVLLCYAEDDENLTPEIKDPYEKFNRAVFQFNDTFDKCCLKPVAKLYKKIMPIPLNKGITHIFQNLRSGSAIFNDLLQANFYQTTSDSWRFAINSTIGIGGLFDVAAEFGLPYNSTNFGITLAKWGYQDSNYLVLPFWGATTVRDTLGLPADYLTSIYPYIPNIAQRNAIGGVEILDTRAQALRFEHVYETLALDRYIFIRNAYLQHRKYLVKRSQELDNPYIEKTPKESENSQDIYYLDE